MVLHLYVLKQLKKKLLLIVHKQRLALHDALFQTQQCTKTKKKRAGGGLKFRRKKCGVGGDGLVFFFSFILHAQQHVMNNKTSYG